MEENSDGMNTTMQRYPDKRRWSPDDRQYLEANLGKQTYSQMARHLGRTERSVRLYCLRHKLTPGGPKVKRNLLVELLKVKFRNLEDFTPSRAFYDSVQMSQKRYWDLFFGRKQIMGEEYVRIAEYLGITRVEALESRQMELF